MKNLTRFGLPVVLFVSLFPAAIPAAANVVALDTCPFGQCGFIYSGGIFTIFDFPGLPLAINNSGQIVGQLLGGSSAHGFLYSGGIVTTIDFPGTQGGFTTMDGINNAGVMLGHARGVIGPDYTFLYSGGVFTTLNFGATAINDLGQIVGVDSIAGVTHGFLYDGGLFSTIDFPGATYTHPSGINNAGQIVGTEGPASTAYNPFLYINGAFTSFDVPGSVTGGINNHGEFVGFGSGHGFLYSNGAFTALDFPGFPTYPTGINDSGQIVGYLTQPFVSIPEPSTAELLFVELVLGAGVWLWWRKGWHRETEITSRSTAVRTSARGFS